MSHISLSHVTHMNESRMSAQAMYLVCCSSLCVCCRCAVGPCASPAMYVRDTLYSVVHKSIALHLFVCVFGCTSYLVLSRLVSSLCHRVSSLCLVVSCCLIVSHLVYASASLHQPSFFLSRFLSLSLSFSLAPRARACSLSCALSLCMHACM